MVWRASLLRFRGDTAVDGTGLEGDDVGDAEDRMS